MAERIILIRHGQVEDRYAGSYLGRLDAALSDVGRRQADAVAEKAVRMKPAPEVLLASPLKRAIETAKPIAAKLNLDVQIDSDLIEIDFGKWSGKTFSQIQAGDPKGAAEWEKSADDFTFPDGESIRAFFDRAELLGKKLASHPVAAVAVVGHGGLFGAMICRMLRLGDSARGGLAIGHGSISVLACRDGWALLESLNDRCHLEAT